MPSYKTLKVSEILLDEENARHEFITEQSSIIKYLVKNEGIKPLAKDISEHGLSPIDLIAVINNSGHYIAVEGNRRLCALILLNNPAKHQATSKYFYGLAESGTNIPSEIICKEFDSRKDVNLWIERKHEGEQGGIGTKSWSPEGKQRHNSKNNKADINTMAIELFKYAKEKKIVPNGTDGPILTTATRYLGNKYFRNMIGIVSTMKSKDISINVSPKTLI